MGCPIILTGTIDSSVFCNTGNIITDVQERLHSYENTITDYIFHSAFDKIIFVENSNYSFDAEKYIELASQKQKQFEFLTADIHKEEILLHGKSWGDAYLISYAVANSSLLDNEEYFYKATGRIRITNLQQLLSTKDKHRNEFIIYDGVGWCLTYFFKANKHDFMQVLGTAYQQCDERTVNDIEIVFYRLLRETNLDISSFSCFPVVDGKMGATGRDYSGSKAKQNILSFLCKIGVFNFNKLSSKIFWKTYGLIGKGPKYK